MTRIDARGLKCPWPALRAARGLRETGAVEIMADDPAAERELAAIASAQSLVLERIDAQLFRIAPAHVNRSFTGSV